MVVVSRSSYDGLRLSHDKSWQIADIHRITYIQHVATINPIVGNRRSWVASGLTGALTRRAGINQFNPG